MAKQQTPRIGGPRAAYRPKTRRVPLRLTERGFARLTQGTEETGLSASDYVEAKLLGDDPRRVGGKMAREEEAREGVNAEA